MSAAWLLFLPAYGHSWHALSFVSCVCENVLDGVSLMVVLATLPLLPASKVVILGCAHSSTHCKFALQAVQSPQKHAATSNMLAAVTSLGGKECVLLLQALTHKTFGLHDNVAHSSIY